MIHIAGVPVQVGPRLRQRCAWCGAVLIDQDLNLIAVSVGQEGPFPTWPVTKLLEQDGVASYVVPHEDGDQMPEGSCVYIDDSVTV